MARVYLGLGSNISPEENLRLGVRELRWRYGDPDLSGVYQSAAVGFEGEDFWNLVAGVDTDDDPEDILAQIEIIHGLAGRDRGSGRFTSRPLDIDLLLVGDQVLDLPGFHVPREDVLRYSFVLRPLAEIDPGFVHPETGRTIAEHWREFDAESHPLEPIDVIL